ncbi:Bug family tripartite tricarboxylate transporter substrate binding protein [Comamonas sp. J-3]|uniref:Bug family tripartite tricarboxylate transporter substrate binding protein n=1 Tax=Comamonas trifloxystrobinivorans TaxID=3350256 RepID=UPI00372B557B
MKRLKRWMKALVAGVALYPLATLAAYPEKPIRLIIPFAAGSLTDVVFRVLSPELERELGQPVVIDNKPGASGIIGTQLAVNAAPDGYTLVSVGVTNGASNKALFKNLSYNPSKDFASIGKVAESPYLLVSASSSPIDSAASLARSAKNNPEKIAYAYASGSAQVSGAMLAQAMGGKFSLVPYKSSPQILTDIIGGTVDTTLSDFAGGMAQVKAGKLRALGVTTKERFPLAPEVPTLIESGVPNFDVTVWFGLVGPSGLPEAVIARLSSALNKALVSSAVTEHFSRQGITATPSSPQVFHQFLRKEIETWASMVQAAGLEPQ